MHLGKPGVDRATTDFHCQSIGPLVHARRRTERDIRQLLELVPSLLAQGRLVRNEWVRLQAWAATHRSAMVRWPVYLIYSRLQLFFVDHYVDEAECEELRDLLTDLGEGTASLLLGSEGPPALPIESPAPIIAWRGETFVFTGRFAFGTLRQCEREVVARGGRVADRVTTLTNVLVIGSFTSRDRVETSYGRKIEDAVSLRHFGLGVRIVGEDHWTNALTHELANV